MVSIGAGARKPPEILPEGLDGGMGGRVWRWTVVLIMAP